MTSCSGKLSRMKTFIKAKLKKLDVQTNINKYIVAVNITVYNIISKLISFKIIILTWRRKFNNEIQTLEICFKYLETMAQIGSE